MYSGMTNADFIFRAYGTDSDVVVTVKGFHDLLDAQVMWAKIVRAVRKALSGRPATCRMIFKIEGAEPVSMEWDQPPEGIGNARLSRGEAEAMLLIVPRRHADIGVPPVAEWQGHAAVAAAIAWSTKSAPAAALAYFAGETDLGLNTVAMCVSSAYLRLVGAKSG